LFSPGSFPVDLMAGLQGEGARGKARPMGVALPGC
jgi:hypothetical protein